MIGLLDKKCIPCQGGITPLTKKETTPFLAMIDCDWKTINNKKISREFSFQTFRQTIDFVKKVAVLAEQEDHHPDFHIHFNHLILELMTHKIEGLHENDFIMATKIDRLFSRRD